MKKYLSLILITLCSCNLLDKTSESSFTPDNFYKNADDANAAVNAVYDAMKGQNMYDQVMWVLQDQATDDAEWGGGRSTANQAKNDLDKYTFTPATSTFQSVWSAAYQGINRANTVLARVPAVPMDTALKSRLLAEAKFMRGFYYFTLVRLFGGVPLILQETTSLNDLAVARATADEVYTQVIADFSAAEMVLPLTYTGANAGRATRGAAKAFLAKVYLTRADWPAAAAKSKEVMDLGVYGLWDNFADAFALSNKNGKEAVFEVQAVGGGLGEGSYMQGYMRPNFDRVNGIAGFGDDPASANLYNTYRAQDKRREVTIKLYSPTGTPPAPASITFPGYVHKYLDPSATANGEGSNNFPIIRYADVLLMYAEALNEQAAGNVDAYDAVNSIRKRAGLEDFPVTLSQDQFRDSVLLERRLELAFEGHRWYDLVRTRRLISAMQAQNPSITVAERNYLYPIPQTERDVNKNLTQNPLY
ncbi:RagB/SusD family nutrient uptake outer membrane protein [Chitinophaga oryziterrae]|uniref:RagB/SusD family nutrient uptake outer membrane protein n=1 Tax=Chitinophaga oryziterrae TaxID=1031224 RepID=A0A6N8JHA9_9BACT|nr:RagB/SusD family nutrient uptake outer membrane protein [Chitinophaga oryziterrae]MVT44354.1 RagB/SusD family nutrient uptake outer membrane protein [Chitinophaga oryziterrae]